MIKSGRTIAGKLDKPKSDSERVRAKKYYKKKKLTAMAVVLILGGFLIFMTIRAGKEFFIMITTMKKEEEEVEISPTIEVIDETTGVTAKMSSRMREFIANIEMELLARGIKVVQARIPIGKIREVDLSIEGFSGIIKVNLDRGIGVQAEDIERMLKYLEEEEIEEVEYIDVRVDRKAYWK